MAITTEDGVYEALAASQRLVWQKAALTCTTGAYTSLWKATGFPAVGATPFSTPGVVCTSATLGAMPLTNAASGKLNYILRAFNSYQTGGVAFAADRLIHSDGLSGTVTTAQTVGTPTLTRYTDGVGVEIWLEWTSPTGATPQSFTVSYTNTAGTTGRTATSFSPIAASPQPGRMQRAILQAGDTGVLSVQSVTLAGSTGTAGSFGVTLLVTLVDLIIPNNAYQGAVQPPQQTGLPTLQDNACLFLYTLPNSGSTGQVYDTLNVGAR